MRAFFYVGWYTSSHRVPVVSTMDWTLTTPGGTTPEAITALMTRLLNGPKHPGLMILEHELTDQSSQAFINAHPLMVSTGWKLQSAAEINGTGVYLNSKDSASSVERANGILLDQFVSLPVGVSSSSSSSPAKSPTPAEPSSTSNANPGSNTSQSGNNGSIQSTISKLAGAVGAILLTVAFYAW